jgi:hypothetical protein
LVSFMPARYNDDSFLPENLHAFAAFPDERGPD